MSDSEIGAVRQKLANRVRSDDYRQRRKDMDARALQYRIKTCAPFEGHREVFGGHGQLDL